VVATPLRYATHINVTYAKILHSLVFFFFAFSQPFVGTWPLIFNLVIQ
jgi:hypothetical protein